MTDATLYTRLRNLLEALEPCVPSVGLPREVLALDPDSGFRGMGDVAILLHELDVRIRALQEEQRPL
jgi:hypothetical protein